MSGDSRGGHNTVISVNIVGNDNGAGLSRDARLVLGALSAAGIQTTWSKSYMPRGLRRLFSLASADRLLPRYDVNLFLERFHPAWFPHAKRNLLVPNPEWFTDDLFPGLGGIDAVLCKSRQAGDIFRRLGKATRWIGFTSEDRSGGTIAASLPASALHLAGRSIYKGTDRLVAVWRRHPEWPMLTVVQRPHVGDLALDTRPAPNIRFLTERLDDAELLALQREHALHILPSEVEGYGQVLAEGMSVGAVIVTTDAAPMNELVTSERGVLVGTGPAEPMRLGLRAVVDPLALERAIADVLAWPDTRRYSMGMAARHWFVENDRRFREELPIVIRSLADPMTSK